MRLLGVVEDGRLILDTQCAITVLSLLTAWSLVIDHKVRIVYSKIGHGTVAFARPVSINIGVLADLRITRLLDQVVDNTVATWEDRGEVLVLAHCLYMLVYATQELGRQFSSVDDAMGEAHRSACPRA